MMDLFAAPTPNLSIGRHEALKCLSVAFLMLYCLEKLAYLAKGLMSMHDLAEV